MSNLQEVQISASCRPGSRPCARRCVFAVGWLWFSRSLGLRYRRWCNETNKTKTHEGDLKRQLCGLVKQKQKTEVGSIEASRWKRKDAQIAKGNSLIKLRDTQMMTTLSKSPKPRSEEDQVYSGSTAKEARSNDKRWSAELDREQKRHDKDKVVNAKRQIRR